MTEMVSARDEERGNGRRKSGYGVNVEGRRGDGRLKKRSPDKWGNDVRAVSQQVRIGDVEVRDKWKFRQKMARAKRSGRRRKSRKDRNV